MKVQKFFCLLSSHEKQSIPLLQLSGIHVVASCELFFGDICTALLKMIVGVLTTCHTQYTSDSSICIFLFNRTTLQVFVTYLTGALYVHPL